MVCVFKKKEWYALLFRGPVTHAPPHSLLLGSAEIFCSFPTPRLGCGVGGSPSRLSPLASVLRAPAGDPVYAPPSSLPPLLYRGSPACCPVWPGLGSAGAWWRPELAWKQGGVLSGQKSAHRVPGNRRLEIIVWGIRQEKTQ